MAPFNRIVRGLQKVFPSSGLAVPSPKDLSESVSPVYDFPGRQASLDRARVFTATAVSVVTPVLAIGWDNNGAIRDGGAASVFILDGQDVYTEILYGDISHDSATGRQVQLFIQSPGTPAINTAIGRWALMETAFVTGQPSGFEPILGDPMFTSTGASDRMNPRRMLLPPAWKLLLTGNTAAAAYALTIQVVAIVHPLAEPPVL